MINLKFNYKEFININLQHDYFIKTPKLTIKPTLATSLFCTRFNIKPKLLENGIGMFTDKHNSIPFQEYLTISEKVSFDFILSTSIQTFFQVTKLRPKETNELLYFTNNDTEIHKEEYVSENDYITFDDKKIADIKKTVEWFKTGEIGLIRIILTDKDRKDIKNILSPDADIPELSYTIKFKPISSHWRYIFIPYNQDEKYNLEIKSLRNNELKFTAEEQTTDERKKYIYTSTQPLELKERNNLKLELWNYKSKTNKNTGKILRPYLPIPTKISYQKESKYTSEIYLNI